MKDSMSKQMYETSYLSGNNASYIEDLYETYLKNPNEIDAEWRDYFRSLPRVNGLEAIDISHADIQQQFSRIAQERTRPLIVKSVDVLHVQKQAAVERLIQGYRRYGHLAAKIDPLAAPLPEVPELELGFYQLSHSDYNQEFKAVTLMGDKPATLHDIRAALVQTYCRTIGFEYSYIDNIREVDWLIQRIEPTRAGSHFTAEQKRANLALLTAAEGLEKYLGTKYTGQKRFSLEGSDSLVPLLHTLIQQGGQLLISEMVIAMAHRGRLNVLLNVLGQSPLELFQEFEGKKDYGMTSGDVKYHLGFSSDIQTSGGVVHLSLSFNPSHLEVISAVAMGSVRARQDRKQDIDRNLAMPIIIHGDASFAGQGIVMETLNMSQTHGYSVGGSVHIVVNNQIGFTTSDPKDARSSHYCTDIAKMIEAPVFHVNADDPEAVVFAAQLALDYRMRFHKDVVIDLVCYRRHGHQEIDEPSATQPMMYKKINQHPTVREIYAQQLISEKIIAPDDVEKLWLAYRDRLDQGQQVVDTLAQGHINPFAQNWTPFIDKDWNILVDTSTPKPKLIQLATQLEQLPPGFVLQRQVQNLMDMRKKMTAGVQPLDWGYAETLAYATLLEEGYPIRISGQDCRRGTFAHRHAVLFDQETGKAYCPLRQLKPRNGKPVRFEIYDSLLSEQGVLGFEYGYANAEPNTLVIWEAQYGDFANGAQMVIDQFISSGWQKWKRLCSLVMFLPHGYEGGGPEHSSARLERYLQLCAQHNMQVCVPTTPAQTFHMLRRQMLRPFRKPLIVMTPKSMLRNKLAVSSLEDLAQGQFYLVIPEIDKLKPQQVKRVVLCSGRVYYDLLTARREKKLQNIAIIRIEQLYPFPYDEVKAELKRYSHAKKVVWCQEEPKNQGAWYCTRHCLFESLMEGQELIYAGREASAAPAVGYPALHAKQQQQLIEQALAD